MFFQQLLHLISLVIELVYQILLLDQKFVYHFIFGLVKTKIISTYISFRFPKYYFEANYLGIRLKAKLLSYGTLN